MSIPFETRFTKLARCEKNAINLLDEQNKFCEEYKRTAELVLSGNEKGLKFSGELENEPKEFNRKLMSPADVKESLETMALYHKNIVRMSDEMNQFFSKQYLEMEKMVNSGNAIKMSFETGKEKSENSSKRRLQMSFGQLADFYNESHSNIQQHIDVVRKRLECLEKLQNDNRLRYKAQIYTISKGVKFIEKTLNAKTEFLTSEDEPEGNEGRRKRFESTGNDQFRTEKENLAYIKSKLKLLTSYKYWKITEKANKLNTKLETHLEELELIESQFRKDFPKPLSYSLCAFVLGLLAALIIMVIADFLCAHFDTAVSLQEIKRKMIVFLLLPCLSLLFLCGCGESPEECLKKELPQLINIS